jgi:hypothetical protein
VLTADNEAVIYAPALGGIRQKVGTAGLLFWVYFLF